MLSETGTINAPAPSVDSTPVNTGSDFMPYPWDTMLRFSIPPVAVWDFVVYLITSQSSFKYTKLSGSCLRATLNSVVAVPITLWSELYKLSLKRISEWWDTSLSVVLIGIPSWVRL